MDISSELHGEDADNRHIQWVHLESKRRLLLACFILEVQQISFFGSHRLAADRNLPLPCSAALWEASSIESWLCLARQEPLDSYSLSEALSLGFACNMASDAFSSNISIAYFTHNAVTESGFSPRDLLGSIQQTPQMLYYSHAALLTTCTPIRDLLAVSGETFVLGEKLATRDQFVQAIADLRSWVASENAAQAMVHARHLLRIAFENRRTGLMIEDWALYLAALVCWACRMWPVQEAMHDAFATEPFVRDVDDAMRRAVAVDFNIPMEWKSARVCLAWTRRHVTGKLGGLLEDAVGVVGKLVDGRTIDVEHRAVNGHS